MKKGILKFFVAGMLVLLATPLEAQETEGEEEKLPLVVVEKVTVEPADPGPDTLCKLTVKLRNSGTEIASLFAFTVEINGQKLPVYDKELFAFPVDPGSAADL